MAEREKQEVPRKDKGEASSFRVDHLQQAGEGMATPGVDTGAASSSMAVPGVEKGEASSSSLQLQQAEEVIGKLSYKGRELPTENFELVLASLPYHALCQFQLVSKGWQRLIAQPHQKRLTLRPEIASLRTEPGRQVPYILITPKAVPCDPYEDPALYVDKRRDWHILDMAGEKYYTFSDAYVDVLLADKPIRTRSSRSVNNLEWSRFTMAADGDLIYAVYVSANTGVERHVLCNPVTETYHEIDEPQIEFSEDNIVVMSVDKSTNRYKIVLVEAYGNAKDDAEGLYFYDSTNKAKEWTYVGYVAGQKESGGKYMWAYSCIFFEDIFYTVFADLSMVPWCIKLYTCDLTDGSWRHINVDLPQPLHPQERSQLVVCSSRLFFIEYTAFLEEHNSPWENILDYTEKHQVDISISELLLHNLIRDKMVKKVATKLDFASYCELAHKNIEDVIGEPLIAVGCGDSIVISTSFTHHLVWDLVAKCWHNLPATPKYLEMLPQEDHRQGFCAGILEF